MVELSVIREGETPVYPLPIEATLTGFGWWKFDGARLLTPDFKANTPMDLRGYALALWDHAMREGAPAGTLPRADDALAVICELGHDRARFRHIKQHVLDGWAPCICRGGDGETETWRLYHPTFQAMALEAFEKRECARARRESKTDAQKQKRVAARLREAGAGHVAERPERVAAILARLTDRGMRATKQHVIEIAEEIEVEQLRTN